jgi:dCMP deaminase
MILKEDVPYHCMIVGIVGAVSAREDVISYFEKKGFIHVSLDDEVHSEAQRRGLLITKQNLATLKETLQNTHGKDIFAKWAQIHLKENKLYVISGLSTIAESNFLHESSKMILLGVATNKKKTGLLPQAEKIILHTENKDILHQKIDQLHVRPSWDEYFMGIVDSVSTRATCSRGRTAVVIVKDKRILTTGYVGSPMGIAHCDDVGHHMKRVVHEDGRVSQHCVRTIHGEQNAIALAARKGIPLEGGTLYCKLEPCYTCAKMLINTGIVRVVCKKRYHAAQDSRVLFKEAQIELVILQEEVESYANQ